jgi:hypothetical protein
MRCIGRTPGKSTFPAAQATVEPGDFAGGVEGERDGVVGDRLGAVVGDVAHGDPAGRGGGDVDRIDADPVAGDDSDLGEGVQDLSGDGGVLDDEGIGSCGVRDQGGRIGRVRDDEFVAGGGDDRALFVESVVIAVGDDDAHGKPRLLVGPAGDANVVTKV